MNAIFVLALLLLGVKAIPIGNMIDVEEFETPDVDYELPSNKENPGQAEFTESPDTVPMDEDKKRNAINVNTYRGALWPNGIVPYTIHSSYSASVRNIFIAAMHEIEEDSKVHGKTCVQFVPKTSSHHDYIEIVPTTGCHSPVGHHPGHAQVSLGHGCERKGTVMHEMLHVLGFYHEHERYDRDNYITVHLDNIPTERQKEFGKSNTNVMNTLGVSYDYSSIMHYGAYTFAKDPSKPVLTPKHHSSAVIGQRLALSRKDIEKIQLLYSCGIDLSHIITPSTPHKMVDCSFDHGICNLHQDNTDTFNWAVHRGHTATSGTGPNADHTNSAGKYLLAQARHHHNKVARISTDTIPAGQTCVTFSYFIYGSGVKSLSMKAQGTTFTQTIKTFSGSQQNQWVNLNFNINVPRDWKLIFEASIGSSDFGDIAIDDLSVYQGQCIHQ